MSITLTVGNKTIKTLSADGTTVLDTQVNPAVYQFASLGELKCLEIDITLDAVETFLGTRILFNPALFGMVGYQFDELSGNNTGWTYTVTASTATGTDLPMNLVNSSNSQINNSCYINFSAITPNPAAKIKFYYYQTADTGNFLQGSLYDAIDNNRRLRTSAFPQRTLSLIGSIAWVLKTKQYWGVYNDDNSALNYYIKVSDTATQDYSSVSLEIPYEAKLNEVNFKNTAPDISAGTFKLYDGATLVTKLQLNEPTKVEIRANCSTAITNVIAWLVRSDTADQSVTFLENYEPSHAEIITDATIGTPLQNAIISPSVAPTLEAGTTYKASFHVDNNLIEIGATYKIIAVWYDTVNLKVNTWISAPIATGGIKDYDDELIFMSFFEDYNGKYSGNNLGVAPEERLKASVNIVYDQNTNLFTPRITGMSNVISSHDLRQFLYKIEIETYSTDGVNKDIYTRDVIERSTQLSYKLPNYITMTSPNYNKELTLNYNFRVHHEQELPCLESYINGVKQGKPLVNMNWAGKTIYIQYKFYLQYQSSNPDVQDCLVYLQKLQVKKYENDEAIPKLKQTFDWKAVCYGSAYCPEFTLQNVYNPEDFRFIGTISKQNFDTTRKVGTEFEFGCDDNIGGTMTYQSGGDSQILSIFSDTPATSLSSTEVISQADTNINILNLF